MSIDVTQYAERLIAAQSRMRAAGDLQEALDALEEFKVLADDSEMLLILAQAFVLVQSVAFDEPASR